MDSAWLNKSAQLMRVYADTHPWTPGMRIVNYRRTTVDQLIIEFYAAGDDYVLALAREGRDPSQEEIDAALVAFGAPVLLTKHLPPRESEQLCISKHVWKQEYARSAAEKPATKHKPRVARAAEGR